MRKRGSGIERQLVVTHDRIVKAREELDVLGEQLAVLSSDEDDARTRMLVTESTVDRREWRQASGHAGRLQARKEALVRLLADLERTENELLSKLVV